MFNCLVANRFSQHSILKLQQSGIDTQSAEDIGSLKKFWPSANGLLIRSGTQITKKLIEELPELKVVITATSGFDHIDLKACSARNITVMHTPGANAQSAAEHTWGLILASQRKYAQCNEQVRKGQWQRHALIGQEISGKTLGIIGFGRIGQKVYKMAQAFDMHVFVHDPYIDKSDFSSVTFLGYEEVVRKSDIVTYHVPLTKETQGMINPASLEWFNDSATLVNASRGTVLSLDALVNYLPENPHFQVALDVFPNEPLPKESVLLKNPNVFCTPHVGATTEQAIARASEEAVDKMIAFALLQKTSDPLPPPALWAEKLINA